MPKTKKRSKKGAANAPAAAGADAGGTKPSAQLPSSSAASTQPRKRKRSDAGHTSTTDVSKPASPSAPSSASTNNTNNTTSHDDSSSRNGFASIRPPLSPAILTFLSTPPYHFPTPTPVQSTTIPLFLTHHDVFVRAVTGSGKTLAFLIPAVEMILRRTALLKQNQIGALILEPTRELARQVHTVCGDLCKACGMAPPLLLVGGGGTRSTAGGSVSAVSRDLHRFASDQSDIVIGTPGRVEDILTRYDNVDVSELEVLILDESDVLLDMGFEVTLTSILGRLPRMRRTGLFSATNTGGVKRLCQKSGMRNPVVVDVAIGGQPNEGSNDGGKGQPKQATPASLTNYHLVCPLDEKLSRLVAFLTQHAEEKVIVFFLTCACVEYYSTVLQQIQLPCKGYSYEALHGKLVQKRREKAMERFRARPAGALLCTDVAARGLDVPDVGWTVQFDAPVDPAAYVHRVGRSARAGKRGKSLVFLTRKEEAYVDFLRLRKVPLGELEEGEVCKPPVPEEEDAVGAKEPSAKGEANEPMSGEAKPQRILRSAAGPAVVVPDVLPSIRQLVLTDRDVLEKGTKAYTSYVRAYKEHHCSFIFRFASLDLGLLATSFSLLRLPKMPELRDRKVPHFVPAGPDVNIHAIAFQDKARETARQKRLAAELAAGGKNAKQIKAEQRAAERAVRAKERRAAEVAKGRNPHRKKGRQQRIFDEWDELAKEERLYKKLRSKKISQGEYDRLMYGEGKGKGGGANNGSDDEEESD